jgi:hypothetical protein
VGIVLAADEAVIFLQLKIGGVVALGAWGHGGILADERISASLRELRISRRLENAWRVRRLRDLRR